MAQVDAHQDCEMKRERADAALDLMEEPPTKKHKKVHHNDQKCQALQLSEQLLERIVEWEKKGKRVLDRTGHGIPTVAQIKKAGRTVDDKANLRQQCEAEREKIANLRREPVTLKMLEVDPRKTELSND